MLCKKWHVNSKNTWDKHEMHKHNPTDYYFTWKLKNPMCECEKCLNTSLSSKSVCDIVATHI